MYFTDISGGLCYCGQFVQKAFEYHTDFHVLQSDYVNYLDIAGISGSGHHGGGGRGRRHEPFILCDPEKDTGYRDREGSGETETEGEKSDEQKGS